VSPPDDALLLCWTNILAFVPLNVAELCITDYRGRVYWDFLHIKHEQSGGERPWDCGHLWTALCDIGTSAARLCHDLASFQVLTAASMKVSVFWDAAPCSLALSIWLTFGRSPVRISPLEPTIYLDQLFCAFPVPHWKCLR
jgi:hypothetical protein